MSEALPKGPLAMVGQQKLYLLAGDVQSSCMQGAGSLPSPLHQRHRPGHSVYWGCWRCLAEELLLFSGQDHTLGLALAPSLSDTSKQSQKRLSLLSTALSSQNSTKPPSLK